MIKPDNLNRTSITVRGYELDSYGHVNNAVYLQYLEQARWVFIKDLGILDYMNAEELLLIVIETNIRYLKEANLFDELIIESTVKQEKPYLVFRQKIYNKKESAVVSRATVKTLFVNKGRMPLDIPLSILKKLP
ncbi:MAG: thioesterase family protein [Bacteroidales bacterium]|jgi:acyl-CoA thioester hydrolase